MEKLLDSDQQWGSGSGRYKKAEINHDTEENHIEAEKLFDDVQDEKEKVEENINVGHFFSVPFLNRYASIMFKFWNTIHY